jgi:uncharacterized membrane protein
VLIEGLLSFGIFLAIIASILGLYGRYRDLAPIFTGPQICKLEGQGCQILFRTPDAALLGPPNSLLGLIYFPLLALGLIFKLPLFILFISSCFSLLMSGYLAYLLISQKLECRICWTGHFANALVWLTLLIKLL